MIFLKLIVIFSYFYIGQYEEVLKYSYRIMGLIYPTSISNKCSEIIDYYKNNFPSQLKIDFWIVPEKSKYIYNTDEDKKVKFFIKLINLENKEVEIRIINERIRLFFCDIDDNVIDIIKIYNFECNYKRKREEEFKWIKLGKYSMFSYSYDIDLIKLIELEYRTFSVFAIYYYTEKDSQNSFHILTSEPIKVSIIRANSSILLEIK